MQKAAAPHQRECVSFIDGLFAKGLADSVSSLLGESVDVNPVARNSEGPQTLWFRSGFRNHPQCFIEFGTPKQRWLEIAAKILGSDEVSDLDDEVTLSTLKEISSQVAGNITTSVNNKYSQQLEALETQIIEDASETAASNHVAFFHLSFKDYAAATICFVLPEALLEVLVPEKVAVEKTVVEKTLVEVFRPPDVSASKLELLLDVELPVSVSLGRAEMPLKDVIRLTTGSIVELSQNVSELVEIVVNNCVVAKGEVVIVEGNFGIRIKEVLSKEDRMSHLAHK